MGRVRPTRRGIPVALEAAVIAEANKNRPQREIAAWLADVHGVRVSHKTVGKLIKDVRAELGEATRATVVSEIAPQVVGHIAGLQGVIERSKAIEQKATEGMPVLIDGVPLLVDGKPVMVPAPGLALKALDIQRKAHVDVLKIAGADSASDGVKALADLLRAAGE